MRSGLFLPLFDPLADPAAVARLAGKAEEAGWDEFFVWDQIHWREPVAAVGDTQVTLAAIAAAIERIRLGPLVTPLARRRPAKVARETAALDLLSGGRLTLGVGLGSDRFASEYSITGAAARATPVDADERDAVRLDGAVRRERRAPHVELRRDCTALDPRGDHDQPCRGCSPAATTMRRTTVTERRLFTATALGSP